MPTKRVRRPGVTLIEMVVVIALVGILVAVTFPSVSAGVDTLRLNAASDSVVSFLNEALNRAERRQEVVEVTVLRTARQLRMRSSDPHFGKTYALPEGVRLVNVLPPMDLEPDAPRVFFLYPGGTVPRLGIELANAKNTRRIVRVDPITGVPQIERPQ